MLEHMKERYAFKYWVVNDDVHVTYRFLPDGVSQDAVIPLSLFQAVAEEIGPFEVEEGTNSEGTLETERF